MNRHHRLTTTAGLLVALLAAAFSLGCQSDTITDDEARIAVDIYRTGLEMEADPYVRAETLRALATADDPRLAEFADPLTRDPDPMVRLAALDTLIHYDASRARDRAMLIYNQGDVDERRQVLHLSADSDNSRLRNVMLERAQRSSDASLRRLSLERGLIADIQAAQEEGDEELLERDLYPKLGRHVDDDDLEVASLALRRLLEAGQEGRAQRFLERLQDEQRPIEERRRAAELLLRARADSAAPVFADILQSVGAHDPDELGIPDEPIDDQLLRLAVLGLVALGNDDFIAPAQAHLHDADVSDHMTILEALSANPNPEITITLRADTADANDDIRRQAIDLYGERQDARASTLFRTLRRDDLETQRRAVSILSHRFLDDFREDLDDRLHRDDLDDVEDTLQILQETLRRDEELAVLSPLGERLEFLATHQPASADLDEETRAQVARIQSLAAFLLFCASDEGIFEEVIQKNPDSYTRYVYLAHLIDTTPTDHLAVFRNHLKSDRFALRLMAATGLWHAGGADLDLDELGWLPPPP